MSWLKIFSAVLVANIVAFFVLPFLAFLLMVHAFESMSSDIFGVRAWLDNRQSSPVIMGPSAEELKARQRAREAKLSEQRSAQVQAKREKARKERIQAQHNEMCQFWEKEFRKYRDGESKAYRDLACRRYRESLAR